MPEDGGFLLPMGLADYSSNFLWIYFSSAIIFS
jgi:hypothetical protein